MFTFNRIDYTASDLNTVWDDTLKATASILPPNIRIREDGSSFDDLDFDEGTMYSRAVFRPDQVVKLVSQTALSCGFLGSWGYAGTSNGDSVLTVRDIPIITIPKDGTFDGFVAASKKRLLEEANGNIENYNTLYGAFLNSSFYQMQNNLKNDKDRRFTFSRKPSMGFTKAASASGSTFLVEAKFILTGLTYSVSLSSLTYTGYKYTTGSRIGWRPSNSTSKETFGEQGYDAWALGVATTVTMETD